MHAATAVSGSAPAYLYAFVEALEARGGPPAGLPPDAAARLARVDHRRRRRPAGARRRGAGRAAPPGDLARRHHRGGAEGADWARRACPACCARGGGGRGRRARRELGGSDGAHPSEIAGQGRRRRCSRWPRERPWRAITLRDVAERAGVAASPISTPRPPGQGALLLALSQARLDQRGAGDRRVAPIRAEVHDRLFDAVDGAAWRRWSRDRAALICHGRRGERPARHRRRTAAHRPGDPRGAPGVDATPPRLAAMTAVWARVAQVWRDDEGALNRTMAEIDKRLKQMRARLARIGAGF